MTENLRIEPKIGEIITINGIKYRTQLASDVQCSECAFQNSECWDITCNHASRKDRKAVIFKKVETNMNEVKIKIPNNCELVKEGSTYVVREKKQGRPPRSWEEFCEKYPVTAHEAMICGPSSIILAAYNVGKVRRVEEDKNWIVSKEEAEAFLALMQLRQLRKAWVGDWEQDYENFCAVIFNENNNVIIEEFLYPNGVLSFPTKEMAEEFLNCFRNLCETAKSLI